MQLKLALTALISVASVLAVPNAESKLDDRAAAIDGHVYLCTNVDFEGLCNNFGFTDGACQNLPDAFNGNVSSVGPDQGVTCSFYA